MATSTDNFSHDSSKRSADGLLYNDDAHRDAYGALDFMGLWNFKIGPEMVGKTYGEAIDELLQRDDVPYHMTPIADRH